MYRLEVKVISRGGKGYSAVTAAAYRSGQNLSAADAASYRAGEADYSRKRGVVVAEIHAPEHAPAWMTEDRGRLWASVDAGERRKDAQLCREVLVTLPRDLSPADRLDLVRGFVNESLVGRGLVCDVAIHDVKARDGSRNVHAHCLTTMRELRTDGSWGGKLRDLNKRAVLGELRQEWASAVNWQLERAGLAERVDHRSLETRAKDALARGDFATLAKVDREPMPKLGRAASQMERKGRPSAQAERVKQVECRNVARNALYERLSGLGEQAKGAFMAMRERLGDVLQAKDRWGAETGVERGSWVGAMDRSRSSGREVERG